MSHPTGPKLVVALVLGIVTVQALMLFAFSWPAANSGPREVPVAVVGPPEAVATVEQGMAGVPGPTVGTPAFDVVTLADEAAARQAIEDREVYGAVIVGPGGPQVLVASAAGPAVAQLLTNAAGRLAPDGSVPQVDDIVPTPEGDPTGAGLAAGLLPLVMTSAAGGLAASLLLTRRVPRLAAVSGLAVVAGAAAAALLQYGLGVVDGPYWAVAGVLTLLIGAVAAAVAGFGAVLGRPGAILGMLLMLFVGNPFSAAAAAPHLLPQPWGDIGQAMPPGAGVTAARSVAFFDGAAASTPLLVLSAWLLAGLVLMAVGTAGRQSVAASSTAEPGTPPGSVENRGTDETRPGART